MKIFFQAEAPKAARKKKIRLLLNRGYPRTTTVNIPHKTASVLYLNAVISGLMLVRLPRLHRLRRRDWVIK